MGNIYRLISCIGLLCAIANGGVASATTPVTTLALALSDVHLSSKTPYNIPSQKLTEADITIRNTGTAKTEINAGDSLGLQSFPVQFTIVAVNGEGETTELSVAGQPVNISGRIDPWVIELNPGDSHTFHALWSALLPGTYRLYAEFRGTTAQDINTGSDTSCLPINNCWIGSLKSDEVSLIVP